MDGFKDAESGVSPSLEHPMEELLASSHYKLCVPRFLGVSLARVCRPREDLILSLVACFHEMLDQNRYHRTQNVLVVEL